MKYAISDTEEIFYCLFIKTRFFISENFRHKALANSYFCSYLAIPQDQLGSLMRRQPLLPDHMMLITLLLIWPECLQKSCTEVKSLTLVEHQKQGNRQHCSFRFDILSHKATILYKFFTWNTLLDISEMEKILSFCAFKYYF